MLIYRRTSILESAAQTLVNTVNCVGVMGKGLAKAFKEREPEMFVAYRSICERKLLEPGKLWLWQGSQNWILNFPTKKHWRNPSHIEWIEAGLEKFVTEYAVRGIREVSFPRLGCGNGGLDWDQVRPLMEAYLGELEIPVYVHDYTVDIGLPEHVEQVSRRIRVESADLSSFEGFVSALRRITELGDGTFAKTDSNNPFCAQMDARGNLKLETGTESFVVEIEDLRGIWLSLVDGLVTEAQAGWSHAGTGSALISLLSALPQARLIQVELPGEEAQLAVELLPSSFRASLVPEGDKQFHFGWA